MASFRDDPFTLREFRYVKPQAVKATVDGRSTEQIALIVNDRHDIHHVHERGYVESPVRVKSILKDIETSGLFATIKPRPFPDKHIHAVHDADFVGYLQRACAEVPDGKSVYPYVFPIRNKTRPPKELSVLAGYYCIDTFTPLNRNAYLAARRGVDCALTAAREILDGRRIAYALVRPPGHHAERRAFGGFCYFNNTAIAAQYLCAHGKVAILDVDYHHGNGSRTSSTAGRDVLTVSIHGHPSFAYPYFTGFDDERGEGDGEGFNLNLPLPEEVDGEKYRKALGRRFARSKTSSPSSWWSPGTRHRQGRPHRHLVPEAKDFDENGRMIGALGLPTLVVQEGGYRTRTLGQNARNFFRGLVEGVGRADSRHAHIHRVHGVTFRDTICAEDPQRVRRLVDITGFFNPAEVDVAEELVGEYLAKGDASGYHFIMADHYGRLAGYVCFGPIPGTASSYDLYWIAVHPDFQGRGLGRRLMVETERPSKRPAAAASMWILRSGCNTPARVPFMKVAATAWRPFSKTSTPWATARRSTASR